jgi:beta-carotene ketolase (CrtW type)
MQTIGPNTARLPCNYRFSPLSISLASLIIFAWLATLIAAFSLQVGHIPVVIIIFGICIRTFLHTGLFIVTHEAIHQNLIRQSFLNDGFGYLTSFLYALLPYKVLARNHRLHHRFPGAELDPDANQSDISNFLVWYLKFMKTYQADGQAWFSLAGMGVVFCIFIYLHISILNLMLFWVAPMVISSLQLFAFGVFLPHRRSDRGYRDHHRARSIHLPVFWSFITCYHFGYHWEHHQYPYLPWYRLPKAYWNGKP